jgi:putative ATP-binding cassette transporter
MRFLQQLSSFFAHDHLLVRFWQSASEFWRAKKGSVALLAVFLIFVVLIQLLTQILLNMWNRRFFDALEQRDAHALWVQARLFIPLAMVSAVLAATAVWGRMTVQRKWREALTHHVVDKWLARDRFRRLNHLVAGTENPEYRIAVDVRIATDAPIDLALAFFSSLLTAIAFFGVLWSVGGNLQLAMFGRTITIPAYLVLGVIVYSGAMSTLMTMSGHHLTGVIESMNQSEAEFRAAVDAFREDPGRKGDTRTDAEKRGIVWRRFPVVLGRWKQFCWQLVRTTLVSHSNFILAPVVGWLLCLPKYLSGAMTLGELTQAAAAFVTVQTAFNWLVDNYQRLADWRSSAHRVATLLVALDEIEAQEKDETVAN